MLPRFKKNIKNLIKITTVLMLFLSDLAWGNSYESIIKYLTNGDYQQAIAELQPLIEKKDPHALTILGSMYERGHGVPQDFELAYKYYYAAADKGYAPAQTSLSGLIIQRLESKSALSDDLIKKFTEEAFYFLQEAALQGYARAQVNLGYFHANGISGEVSSEKAVKWYTLAAQQGVAEAGHNLGVMYLEGQGVEQDFKLAKKWFNFGAARNHPLSQMELGTIYMRGQGIEKNVKEAIYWWTLAAENGLAESQFYLGFIYHMGEGGVPKNVSKAELWYTRAAEQGSIPSAINLSSMYAYGEMVPKNKSLAYMWLELVATFTGEEEDIVNRNNLREELTQDEFQEGLRLVMKCLEKKENYFCKMISNG